MARPVDASDVQALFPSVIISPLSAFISAAHSIVNRLETSGDLSDSDLELVETWLSAHFTAVSHPAIAIESEKVEGASVKASRGNVASQSGILSTQFGQMANTLSGGTLVEVMLRKPTLDFI